MHDYDYLIAGAGLAGLTLAHQLVKTGLGERKILLVDHSEKNENDRTWCFWASPDHDLKGLVNHQWSSIDFYAPKVYRHERITPWTYQQIRSIDFYHFMLQQLRQHPNVFWHKGTIELISEDQQGPYLYSNGERIRAKWVFDSITRLSAQQAQMEGKHWQWQHFRGWTIETETAVFTPDRVTLMDFRIPQHGQTRFFYLLPFSPNRALVEFTVFSSSTFSEDVYQKELERYIRHTLRIDKYRILERETGQIPMTNLVLDQQPSPHHIRLGTAAGLVKPSTGYAFWNILKDSKCLARNLIQSDQIMRAAPSAQRFQFYDELLLYILENKGAAAQSIFSSLFLMNPFKRILRFLGEESHPGEEALLFLHLPWGPFLEALAAKNPLYQRLISAQVPKKSPSL